jgi:hypothetical protein
MGEIDIDGYWILIDIGWSQRRNMVEINRNKVEIGCGT